MEFLNDTDHLQTELSLKESVQKTYGEENTNQKPVSSGIDWVDEITNGGFWKAAPNVLSGESANGKSTLAFNSALRNAVLPEYGGNGLRVLFISMELPNEQVTAQFLGMMEDESFMKWMSFNLEGEEREKKLRRGLKLADYAPSLYIDDKTYTPSELCEKIRDSKGKYDILYIDYFQRLDFPSNRHQTSVMNEASKEISNAIKETKEVAVVILSQVTVNDKGGVATTRRQHQNATVSDGKQLYKDAVLDLRVYLLNDEEDNNGENYRNSIFVYTKKARYGQPAQEKQLPFYGDTKMIGDWRMKKSKEDMEELFDELTADVTDPFSLNENDLDLASVDYYELDGELYEYDELD